MVPFVFGDTCYAYILWYTSIQQFIGNYLKRNIPACQQKYYYFVDNATYVKLFPKYVHILDAFEISQIMDLNTKVKKDNRWSLKSDYITWHIILDLFHHWNDFVERYFCTFSAFSFHRTK